MEKNTTFGLIIVRNKHNKLILHGIKERNTTTYLKISFENKFYWFSWLIFVLVKSEKHLVFYIFSLVLRRACLLSAVMYFVAGWALLDLTLFFPEKYFIYSFFSDRILLSTNTKQSPCSS